MVEATIGTVLLLLAALGAIQLVLVFHGALASYGAVIRASRTYAITREDSRAADTFRVQMSTAIKALQWTNPQCGMVSGASQCSVTVTIPTVLPGAGLFTGNSVLGPITITQTGIYPYGDKSAN